MGKVDGFRYGIIRVLLESRLHPDMLFRAQIMSANKQSGDILRDFWDSIQCSGSSDFFNQGFRIKSPLECPGLEGRMDLDQAIIFHHIAPETDPE